MNLDFDFVTGSLIVFMAGMALVVAFVCGVSSYDDVWIADCEKTGLHRSGNKVFDCKPRGAQ